MLVDVDPLVADVDPPLAELEALLVEAATLFEGVSHARYALPSSTHLSGATLQPWSAPVRQMTSFAYSVSQPTKADDKHPLMQSTTGAHDW